MPDADQELVRRVLESVLRRLDERAAVAPSPSVLNATSVGPDNPVIFIVLGNLEHAQNAERGAPLHTAAEAINVTSNEATPAPGPTLAGSSQSAHPGLDKFPLAAAPANASVPKMCFMEPDRICVHSGACEMRGY